MKKETLSPADFCLLCFLVLMENGAGIIDKAPAYIYEKLNMLSDTTTDLEAFGKLDIHNMRKVIAWHEAWKVKLPESIAENYQRVEEAAAELKRRGVEL